MVVAIIQARMSSTRLPGKVLKKVFGKTLLEHLILRLKRVNSIDRIVVATTTKRADDAIVHLARKLGILYFRGSEEDVLDRYYHAAKRFSADTIVRITADCPLMDPAIIDRVILFYKRGKYEYASNIDPPTFPDGMDVEVFSSKALETAWREARLLSEREHVTPYIRENKKIFGQGNLRAPKDFSFLRLTVDEPSDLILVREVFDRLYKKNRYFGLDDILKLFKKDPEFFRVNSSIKRNEGYKKSLEAD